ncbi:hypothetical protein EJB05_04296 [Eragrostis curvula]|uniref:Uncharacterized protein n=1 Tax=Eragrostis curvula TaxID=38414 RepID=A0A5J9WAE2_9POAL|nr:hypothetical protein EJB05_04296 [Eragrostis curvula]
MLSSLTGPAMMGTAGTDDRRVNAAEDCGLNADEDGYELGDAEKAMPSMQAVERSAAARAHDYEELAARKRKALSHEQLQRGESSKGPVQYDLSEAEATTMFDQLMEGFSRWCKRSSKVEKKRGRKKGTKNKCSPEVTKKLGDATLLFTDSKFKKRDGAFSGLSGGTLVEMRVYMGFLVEMRATQIDRHWREKEDAALARYCILRAMRADPEDTKLKYICADIYCKLNDYHKAAQIYEQIVKIDPTNVFVRKVAAQVFLQDVHLEPSKDNIDVIKELASTFENMEQYEYAVKFYLMIENVAEHDDCLPPTPFPLLALEGMKDNIDIRITLSSLLVDDDKTDEAVTLLSPHNISESQSANIPDQPKPWWCNGEVKMQLAKIYYDKGKLVDFVDTIFLPILETLKIEHYNQKQSTKQVPPVPGLLTNLENHQLVLNRYSEALEIINCALELAVVDSLLTSERNSDPWVLNRGRISEQIHSSDKRRTD